MTAAIRVWTYHSQNRDLIVSLNSKGIAGFRCPDSSHLASVMKFARDTETQRIAANGFSKPPSPTKMTSPICNVQQHQSGTRHQCVAVCAGLGRMTPRFWQAPWPARSAWVIQSYSATHLTFCGCSTLTTLCSSRQVHPLL